MITDPFVVSVTLEVVLNVYYVFPNRLEKLEESLKDDSLTESQKKEKRQQHAQKETEFLRLKRSRLGVEDFEPLKVRLCVTAPK